MIRVIAYWPHNSRLIERPNHQQQHRQQVTMKAASKSEPFFTCRVFLFRSSPLHSLVSDEEIAGPPVMIAGHEGQMAFPLSEEDGLDLNAASSASATAGRSSSVSRKCDRKCCSVGRNHAKQSSWFRQKIHFVDVSKLRQPKLCMKTTLVGDDCKPLLIKAGEDVTVPLVNPDSTKKHQKHKDKGSGHCGKCGLLLDALARTFCLPLLG